MIYTEHLTNDLKRRGFEFKYDNSANTTDDEDLQYEVWEKGNIEITIEHSPKQHISILLKSIDDLKLKSLAEISLLDNLINRK